MIFMKHTKKNNQVVFEVLNDRYREVMSGFYYQDKIIYVSEFYTKWTNIMFKNIINIYTLDGSHIHK